MITRIRTRSELLWYVAEHAPSGACRRAVVEGEVVVLGGFTPIQPWGEPGWIVKVVSVHGKMWLVAVTIHVRNHHYRVGVIEKIPWDKWLGFRGFTFVYDLIQGDIPLQAARAKRIAQEKNNAT